MIKFDFDEKELEDILTQYAQGVANAALSQAVNKGGAKAAEMAKKAFSDKPYSFWKNGFGIDRVGENVFVMTLDGDMANYMDEGDMEGVKQKILTGNRARYNKSNGKDYVDVPFMKDADSAGNVKGTNLKVKAFKDANAMLESFRQSTPLNKQKITKQKAIVKNVQDLINKQTVKQSRGIASANSSYVVIKRVTKDSPQWKDYDKAPKVFGENSKELLNYIEQEFENFLRRI